MMVYVLRTAHRCTLRFTHILLHLPGPPVQLTSLIEAKYLIILHIESMVLMLPTITLIIINRTVLNIIIITTPICLNLLLGPCKMIKQFKIQEPGPLAVDHRIWQDPCRMATLGRVGAATGTMEVSMGVHREATI